MLKYESFNQANRVGTFQFAPTKRLEFVERSESGWLIIVLILLAVGGVAWYVAHKNSQQHA